MSLEFHLRIRATCISDIGSFEVFLKEKTEEYTIGYEVPVDNPENPHFQGYIKTQYKDITIRKLITKFLNVSGNRAYSLSQMKKTKEELLQYVCKDCDVRYTTLQPQEVEVYKAIGSSRKEEIIAKTKKRREHETALQKMMNDPLIMNALNKIELFKAIVKWYIDRYRCLPDEFHLKRLVSTIRLRQHLNANPNYFESTIDNWARRLYQDYSNVMNDSSGENIFL